MRRTLKFALAAVAVAAVAVPAVSQAATPKVSAATTPSATTKSPASTLKWAPCPADLEQFVPLECSTLDVPLDYQKPNGRQIEISISRLASKDPSQRRGILLTNPGGPASPGLNYPSSMVQYGLSKGLQNAYDIIGMDPRGVGRSTPVTCDSTPAQQVAGAWPSYATKPSDVVREAKYAQTVAKQCATSKTASLLPYITTANTARDMDRVRVALGEKKASYLGASYGSYLGAVYTTLFKKTTDRVVLDSIMTPQGYTAEQMRLFGRGLKDRFPDFAKWAAKHPEYNLGSTPQQVRAKYFELAKQLKAKPVPGMDERTFRATTFGYLYAADDLAMPAIAKIWQLVDNNQPVPVQPAEGADNALSARLYVVCGDSQWPTSIRHYQRAVVIDRIKYPMLGGSTANISPCAFWPGQHAEPPVKITDRGPSNILLVQNERDPGTPLASAQQMRKALGQRATMVTVDGAGHGIYPNSPNTCGKNTVDDYLIHGKRPAQDLACAAVPSK